MKSYFKPVGWLVAAVIGLVSAPPAWAEPSSGSRMYVELAQWADDEESFSAAELRWGSVTPLQPGFDFALPFALVPAIITTPDLDLALPIALAPGARIIPRAGVTALVVYGGDIGGAALGWNVGAGLVINAEGPVLLRADYTLRSFGNSGGDVNTTISSVSAGIGWRF